MLAGAFTAAADGTPGFVLLGAEARGGKSRLAAEFAARVSGRALMLTGGCVELGGSYSWVRSWLMPVSLVMVRSRRRSGISHIKATLA